MELVSTMEINREEREIADAYAREQCAANAEGIDGLNNNLDQLEYSDVAGGKNKIDVSKIQYGFELDSTGQPTTKVGWYVTDYISVNPSTKYALSGISSKYVYEFDENKQFIKIIDAKSGLFETSANTKFIRLNSIIDGYSTPQLEEGTTATPYEPYIPSVKMLAEEVKAQIGKCKNLLNPTLQTTTLNGVTCTNNGDGTYTLNGTASANVTFRVSELEIQKFLGKTLRLVGCPKGDSGTTYRMFLTDNQNSNSSLTDLGGGANKTVEQWGSREYWICYISIDSGVTVSNVVFKPMLTTNLSATYDDFVPYTGDGETLTHDVAIIKSDLSKQCKKDDITTNETLIGTFNGKNYYRKLFTGISGSGGSVTVNVGGKIEIYNYYGRAYTYGQSGASDVKYPIPNKNYYIESQSISETSFQLTIPTSSDTRKVDLVIEYTKVDE